MAVDIKRLIDDLDQVDFTFRNSIGLSEDETFGIEIEFEKASLDDVKGSSRWVVKPDDSVTIGNEGGEMVSPILNDNIDTWKQIKNKCNYLKSKQAIATTKTAAHIHIGSQILKDDPNNIRKFLKLWELFENIIFYFSYGKDTMPRVSLKKYARPINCDLHKIRNSKKGYNQFNSYYDWCHFFQKQKFDKTAGINFKHFKGYERDEKNTIEIRCPNGTLNPIIWQNNINFFTNLMIKATDPNFDEEIIDYYLSKKDVLEYGFGGINLLDIEKANMLADVVFDKELDKLLFLKQYLKIFDEEKVYMKK